MNQGRRSRRGQLTVSVVRCQLENDVLAQLAPGDLLGDSKEKVVDHVDSRIGRRNPRHDVSSVPGASRDPVLDFFSQDLVVILNFDHVRSPVITGDGGTPRAELAEWPRY
jgi:hypothetical protein